MNEWGSGPVEKLKEMIMLFILKLHVKTDEKKTISPSSYVKANKPFLICTKITNCHVG